MPIKGDNPRPGNSSSNSNSNGKSGGNIREPEGYLTSYVMKDGSSSYVVSLGEPAEASPTKRLNVPKSQRPVYV